MKYKCVFCGKEHEGYENLVGLKYDSETKTYRQAEKISQTEADKIFKVRAKQGSIELAPIDTDYELFGRPC